MEGINRNGRDPTQWDCTRRRKRSLYPLSMDVTTGATQWDCTHSGESSFIILIIILILIIIIIIQDFS